MKPQHIVYNDNNQEKKDDEYCVEFMPVISFNELEILNTPVCGLKYSIIPEITIPRFRFKYLL